MDSWRQSSIASIPSSVSSAMRSRMCWISSGGGRFQPVISSTIRSGSVVGRTGSGSRESACQ